MSEFVELSLSRWRIEVGAVAAVYWALVAVAMIPILAVRYPQSVDYLNHFARLYILSAPAGDPALAFYAPDWHLVPNIGLELVVLGLNTVLPIDAAMKVAYGLIFLSLPAAFAFFYASLHRRLSLNALLAALCVFNLPLTNGFLSFYLGLATALATLGLWFRMGAKPTARTLLTMNAAGALIVIMHFAALASLGLTVVALHSLKAPWRISAIIKRAFVAGVGFLAPGALLLVMLGGGTPAEPGTSFHIIFRIPEKLVFFLDATFTSISWLTVLGVCALIGSVYSLMRRGGARCDRLWIPALAVWGLVLLVLPIQIGRAAAIDHRLVVFPVLLFLAALSAPPSRAQSLAGAVVATAVVVRALFMLSEWQEYNLAVEDFKGLAQAVEPGSKVLIGSAPPGSKTCAEPLQFKPFYNHVPTLLLTDRKAFIPGLFSAAGMQPIKVREKYAAISFPGATAVDWANLVASEKQEGRPPLDEGREKPWRPYYFGWRDTFDYLLVLSINCAKDIPPDAGLRFLGRSKVFVLYKIVRDHN